MLSIVNCTVVKNPQTKSYNSEFRRLSHLEVQNNIFSYGNKTAWMLKALDQGLQKSTKPDPSNTIDYGSIFPLTTCFSLWTWSLTISGILSFPKNVCYLCPKDCFFIKLLTYCTLTPVVTQFSDGFWPHKTMCLH